MNASDSVLDLVLGVALVVFLIALSAVAVVSAGLAGYWIARMILLAAGWAW
jgi:hypothetical protein